MKKVWWTLLITATILLAVILFFSWHATHLCYAIAKICPDGTPDPGKTATCKEIPCPKIVSCNTHADCKEGYNCLSLPGKTPTCHYSKEVGSNIFTMDFNCYDCPHGECKITEGDYTEIRCKTNEEIHQEFLDEQAKNNTPT